MPKLPLSEDATSQKEKKELMQDLHSREIWNTAQVSQLLDDTYPTVRSIINATDNSITTMTAEWPVLFMRLECSIISSDWLEFH